MYSFYSPLLTTSSYSSSWGYTDPFSGYSGGVGFTANNNVNALFNEVQSISSWRPFGAGDNHIASIKSDLSNQVAPAIDLTPFGYDNTQYQDLNLRALETSASLGSRHNPAGGQFNAWFNGFMNGGYSSPFINAHAGATATAGSIKNSVSDHQNAFGY